tara:strand:+ start:120 stop:410 length:291 start_codon:yes stop_codon:yes gene_type:complete
MAWSVDGNVEIANTPFLIRKISVTTDDANATAVTHSGPAAEPDIVIPVLNTAGDTGGLAITARSTTTVTVDPETSGDKFDLYCIWFASAAGGISGA